MSAVKLLGILQRGAPGGQICDDFITSQAAAALPENGSDYVLELLNRSTQSNSCFSIKESLIIRNVITLIFFL